MDTQFLKNLALQSKNSGTSTGTVNMDSSTYIDSFSPVDGKLIGSVSITSAEEYEKVINTASEAFKTWRLIPAPKRGEIVREYGELLRQYKQDLGKLVSYEMGSHCRKVTVRYKR